ncbi:MAG: PspC domain-containing protein [Prevotella sp.]|jgi:phage shock protein PspC (stress-responsive transcriptional regulator)|nr:PspC domain-containing protein [Prevotella sp.]
MKPTTRVSIGGFAFNLEEDAYNLLNGYLDTLRNHFRDNSESQEIIADIEFRISELLRLRLKDTSGVITLEDTEEIISIMGNPKDFGDNEKEDTEKKEKEYVHDTPIAKRKLYRDLNNKVIGGVCSGIGHYLRVDPIIFRLIFGCLIIFALFNRSIGLHFSTFPLFAFTIAVYILLWIIMPGAKTFRQKLSMSGADPSIENIEDRSQPVKPIYRGSSVSKFLSVLVNIIVAIFIAITALSLIAIIVTFVWLLLDNNILGATNYLVLLGLNTIYFKAAFLSAVLLPVIGLLFLLIKVLRRTSFSTGTLIWFIAGLTIWIVSLIYIGNEGVNVFYQNKATAWATESATLNTDADIVHVRLGNDYSDSKPFPGISTPNLFHSSANKTERQVFILPKIIVKEDTTLTEIKIEIEKWGSGSKSFIAKQNAENAKLDYVLWNSSTILINPQWYSNGNPWQYERFDVTIKTPMNKRIVIEGPLEEVYNTSVDIKSPIHFEITTQNEESNDN